jgi:hypothetical protein
MRALDDGQAPPPPAFAPGGDFSGLLNLVCNEPGWPTDMQTYQNHVALDRVRYPLYGAATASVWPCAFWPVKPKPTIDLSRAGSSNILMVNNLRDPGTVYVGAVELRHAIGGRSRLVTVDAGGHMSYLFGHNTCADDIETTFLVDGTRPATDWFCPGGN